MEPLEAAVGAEVVDAGSGEDSAAEEALVRRFGEKVFLIALVRTRDREAARDLAQETLLAVIRGLREGRLRDPEKLPGYVCGTARNLIANHLRRRGRRPEDGPLPEDLAGPDCESELERDERRLLVRRALAQLVPSDRLILLLTLVDGLKPGEIAARLGLSAEVVRKRKSRALERAREILGGKSQR